MRDLGWAGQLGLLVVALQSLVVEGGHMCEPPSRDGCQSGCQSNTRCTCYNSHDWYSDWHSGEDNMCHGCSGGPADGGYRPLCESNESHPIPISETCPNAITNLPYTDPWNCNNAEGGNNCEMYRSQICDGGPCQQAYHQLLAGAEAVDGWCSPIQGCHDQLWGYPYICVLPSIGVVIVLICICACICVAVKKKMRARRAPPTNVPQVEMNPAVTVNVAVPMAQPVPMAQAVPMPTVQAQPKQ